jgi:hypothetical protein
MAKRPNLLGDSSNDHLQCRDFGHAWKWETDFVPRRSEKKIVGMTRVVVCLRCETRRYDEYAVPSMTKVRSAYEYSDGYRLVGVKGHIPVAEVRQEILSRFRRKAFDG